MAGYLRFLQFIPEVKGPTQKHLSFKEKLKWSGAVLLLFFALGAIPLYGLSENALAQFEFFSVVLGASFGSIISLGVGPIVTASIVLQLLNGSGIISFDLQTHKGKAAFQATQKVLTYVFIIIMSCIYVFGGGFSPAAGVSPLTLIIQLIIGGVFIIFLDDIINKWGFGSGISLFIAAGVSQTVFVQLFSPLRQGEAFVGRIPELFRLLTSGASATLAQDLGVILAPILATVVVFGLVVYVQAMKVEIPLSFGRVRGYGMRWPLNFVYTNVMPIILVSAIVANLQLFGQLLNSNILNAIVPFISNTNLLQNIAQGSVTPQILLRSFTYVIYYMGFAALFSWFWMQTSRMDPRSVAQQMVSSGLQVPGFRKDIRVLERLLKRYIYPLTIMGGVFIGFLAAFADLTGALGTGTGLLLTVMIIYRLYEEVAKQHMEDMNPALRKMMGK
jgi:preprotein translocase subunit SecY